MAHPVKMLPYKAQTARPQWLRQEKICKCTGLADR